MSVSHTAGKTSTWEKRNWRRTTPPINASQLARKRNQPVRPSARIISDDFQGCRIPVIS
jgi:hypothetical protein